MKVLLLHNIFWSHYKADVFSHLSTILATKGIHLYVIHFAKSEIARKGMSSLDKSIHKYQYTVLDREFIEDWGELELYGVLKKEIKQYAPDLVIFPGINSLAVILTTLYCKRANIIAFNSIDSTKYEGARKKTKEFIKKQLLKLYDGLYCYGTLHKDYLHSLGVKNDKIFIRNQSCNNRFDKAVIDFQRKEIDFLYVGRISPEKNLEFTLETFLKTEGNTNFHLVGDGDLKLVLEEKFGRHNRIIFHGYKKIKELQEFYRKSKFFILPSISETWGLVVNEAMMNGLPVLISEHCGCSKDLVKNNGFLFDPKSEPSLLNAFNSSQILSEELYLTLAQNSIDIIKDFTPSKSAEQMAIPLFKIKNKK